MLLTCVCKQLSGTNFGVKFMKSKNVKIANQSTDSVPRITESILFPGQLAQKYRRGQFRSFEND